MNTLKNKLKTAKTLAFASTVVASLILLPSVSMADTGEHGNKHGRYTVSSEKHHHRNNDARHEIFAKNHHEDRHHRHDQHAGNHYGHYKFKRDRDYHHHDHAHYVVNEYYYDDRPFDYLSFIIGLHTNNMDIILRE